MLKRINVHLDDADLKELETLVKKVQSADRDLWGLEYVNRAKLIRYAIAYTFGFEYTDSYPSADVLKKGLRKALKKAT